MFVFLGVGVLIFFNPFEDESTQSTSITDDRGSETPRLDNPQDDPDHIQSNRDSEVGSSLASIFEWPTYFESLVALDDMLKNAKVPTLIDLLDQSRDLQGVERQHTSQTQIFRKFATLDPIKALAHAKTFPQYHYEHFASLIYRDWSSFDLDAALTHAEKNVSTFGYQGRFEVLEQVFRAVWDRADDAKLQIAARLNFSSYSADSVLKKIAREKPLDNPEETWKEVLGAENFGDDERDRLQQIAVAVIEQNGYLKFADLANSIQDRRIRTQLISYAMSNRMYTDDHDLVFNQAVHLFHETARPVLFELAEHWSRADPLSALNGIANVPSDPLKKRLVELAIDTWIDHRPKEVLQQLDLLPVEYREIAFNTGVMSMSAQNPRETTEYLDQISDAQTKWNVMWNLLQNWAYRDIEEAFTWFLDNPDLEIPLGNSRARLLASLLSRVTPESAPTLIELALKYPIDESGSGWEGNVVGFLAYSDMAKAKELLPEVREGPGRINAYVTIGLAIFRQDQSMNSVIELTEEITAGERVEFFGKLVPRLSPQVAYEQIDELPTPEAQARAALGLLQRAEKSSNNPYTDEQIDHLKSLLTDKERAEFELDSPSNR